VYGTLREDLARRLAEVRAAGTYKSELVITTPQGAHVEVEERGELLNLCANNYLGLASHPAIVQAAHEALDRWGYGMASVRFICGTQALHRELERRLSEFLHTEATILFSSCFDANGGLFEALLSEQDAVVSDELNHASIIDGIRLCKARRLRYRNGDMDELEARLREAADARFRLIATDGVFSMDGYLAKLDRICDLAERYDALVMVDDSHGVGVVGPEGRGTHEHFGVVERVDILTGTLGKAIGGASGGYVSGRREIVELLRQRARPYLFSNSVAPPVVAASLRALELIESSHELRDRLRANTTRFRTRLGELGFDVLPGEHPIVPVMIGDEPMAARFSAQLVELGVYAVSFSYPVVPRGTARIRTQMSAAHSTQDVDFAVERFRQAREDQPSWTDAAGERA
jgi:glycine C-acetyltransferase